MNLYFIFIVIVSFIGISFCFKNFNKEYLGRVNTSCIKGIFILIVFYSHFAQYTKVNMSRDFLMYDLRMYLGQLMVTLFLFYSGYGIYESIKNKKDYVKKMPKNRIFKTILHFAIAIFAFLVVDWFLGESYSLKHVLLSLIGWFNVGNSNWYIFGILCLYTSSFLAFSIFNKKKDNRKAIILNYLLTLIICLFNSKYRPSYCYNTLFCYNLGMSYSYHKDEIERILFDKKKFVIILVILMFSLYTFRKLAPIHWLIFEVYAMIFSLLVVQLSLLVNLKSPILKWFGDNLFWMYILQRLPMKVLKINEYDIHPYRFALISFIITILLAFLFSFVTSKFDKLFFRNKKEKKFM